MPIPNDTYYHNAEKLNEALEKIDELIRFNAKYNKPDYINIDLKELKEI